MCEKCTNLTERTARVRETVTAERGKDAYKELYDRSLAVVCTMEVPVAFIRLLFPLVPWINSDAAESDMTHGITLMAELMENRSMYGHLFPLSAIIAKDTLNKLHHDLTNAQVEYMEAHIYE